jgi:NitT/TauT family transport system substrate-binding protein
MTGAGALGASVLSACTNSPAPAAKDASADTAKPGQGMEPLRVAYLPITDATPLLIAHAKGFFAEEGLNVEKPTLIRGWSQLAEAFIAKSFDLAHLLFPIPIYMRYNLNFPVKVVAWNHLNNSGLTVGKKSGITSTADLGGKQIAIPHWYSQHNIVLQLILRAHGLEAVAQDRKAALGPKQVNLFVMAPSDMPPALQTGAIDGYIVAEPFNAAGELLAEGKIIRFNGDVWKNHPCCVAVMHEDTVAGKPEFAQKAVNALAKAQLWTMKNKEEAARILSKDGNDYIPLPAEVLARSMSKYDLETYGAPQGTGAIRHPEWKSNRIGFSVYPYRSATVKMTELLKSTLVEGDTTFLKNLEPEKVADELIVYDLAKKAAEKAGGIGLFEGVDSSAPYDRKEIIEV